MVERLAVSVIIPTLGRADALRVCLESLSTQTVRPAEVVVVHSGADPETAALCAEDWAGRGLAVHYARYPQKSAALQRDFAVRRTSCPLIMFADDDMEFEPEWIESLLKVIVSAPDIAATMGAVLNQPMEQPTPIWRLYRRLVAGPRRAVLPGAVLGALVPNGFPVSASAPLASEWISGCVTLMRREAYLSVNGFAPHYRGSSPGEDIDLGYRLSRTWKVFYVPAARCLHHQSPSGREGYGRYMYYSMRSRYGFCRVSAGLGVARAMWHISLWAVLQTVSELSQMRRGTLRPGFLAGCWGRLRGAWSCLWWDPAAETFPDWHEAHVRH